MSIESPTRTSKAGCVRSCSRRSITVCKLFVFTVLLASLGCQTANYRAAYLPPQYLAAKSPGDISDRLTQLVGTSTDNRTINAGDKIAVLIMTGREEEKIDPIDLKVKENGTIEVPLVGTVVVAGQDTLVAARSITAASVDRGIYRQPNVTVDISEKATNKVTVMGAVKNPGVHEIPRNASDLLNALAVAGGLSSEAGTRVEIIRHNTNDAHTRFADGNLNAPSTDLTNNSQPSGDVQLAAYSDISTTHKSTQPVGFTSPANDKQAYVVDLASLQRGPAPSEGCRLQDRDVVMVVPAQKRVIHISGLVKNPGKYDLPATEDVHLLDALALAGGHNSLVADKVLIIRRIPGEARPITVQASLRKAKRDGRENLLIAAGDTISLEQTPTTIVVDTFARIIHFSVGVTGASTVF